LERVGCEAFAGGVDPAVDAVDADVAVLDGLQVHVEAVSVLGAARPGGLALLVLVKPKESMSDSPGSRWRRRWS
jgi:hypothetical protein